MSLPTSLEKNVARKSKSLNANAGKKTDETPRPQGRSCVFIPAEAYVEGRGWRVSVVFEEESGHFPTGSTPEGGDKEPWYWGRERKDYPAAVECARKYNFERLGLSASAAAQIVSRSVALGMGLRLPE